MGKLSINDFVKEVGDNSKIHGFGKNSICEHVALIHSEVSEILEEARKGYQPTESYYGDNGKPEGIPAELADVVLRCFIMADDLGIDLEQAILAKHEYNKTRPYRHSKKF